MVMTKARPTNSAELETFLADKSAAAEAFADEAKAKTFIEEYAKAAYKRDPDLSGQLSEVQEKTLLKFMERNGYTPRSRVSRLPGDGAEGGDPPARWDPDYRKRLLARANQPGEWGRFAEFLKAIHPSRVRQGQIDARLKVQSEGDPGAGGFLVPEQFVAQLLMLSLEPAVVRPRAFVVPMTALTMRIPALQDTSHASTVFGGVQGRWTPESGTFTADDPSFRQITLTARKLIGYTITTNELMADSAIPLETVLTRLFGEALAYFEDEAFINGTGAGEPLGLINAPALVSVAKETGQAALTVVAENLDKMFSRMLPASLNRAIWIVHPNVLPQLFALSRAVGTGGSAVFVTNMAGAPPTSIYGRPVIVSEKCQTLGTAGDIYFVDLAYYLIGDRQSMTMVSSPIPRITTDETVHVFTQRVDGQPWVNSAITPRYGTTTLSPYVALATRA